MNVNKLGVALVALVLAVAAGGGAYAMWGGDDGASDADAQRQENPDGAGNDVAGICLEGDEDCLDTIDESAGGAAGSSCLVGAEDCADNPGGGTNLGMCAPGYPDCQDMIVENGDCAPDQICGRDVQCDAGFDEDGCAEPDCTLTAPVGAPEIAEESQEPPATIACEDDKRAACDDTPNSSERCLPPDCSVSSDGVIDCATQTDPPVEGEGSEPGNPGTGGGSDPVAPDAPSDDGSQTSP